jgi:hypothetical protein
MLMTGPALCGEKYRVKRPGSKGSIGEWGTLPL